MYLKAVFSIERTRRFNMVIMVFEVIHWEILKIFYIDWPELNIKIRAWSEKAEVLKICWFQNSFILLISKIRPKLSPLVCVWLKNTNTIPFHEFKHFFYEFIYVPWGYINAMSLCLYHACKSIQWIHVYIMSPGL